jgi:hypothetical protein
MTGQDLIKQSLRLARITLRAGRVPATRQLTEGLGSLNSMLGRWSIDRLNVYQIVFLNSFALVAGTKAYTIGSGGTFDTPRPTRIERANILVGTDDRVALDPVDVDVWSGYSMQDDRGQPESLYLDRANAAGLSTIYFHKTPDQAYPLELYVWQPFARLAAVTTTVVFPPEFEEAIVYQLALRLAALDGKECTPFVRETAERALGEIQAFNAPAAVMSCDPAIVQGGRLNPQGGYDWRTR